MVDIVLDKARLAWLAPQGKIEFDLTCGRERGKAGDCQRDESQASRRDHDRGPRAMERLLHQIGRGTRRLVKGIDRTAQTMPGKNAKRALRVARRRPRLEFRRVRTLPILESDPDTRITGLASGSPRPAEIAHGKTLDRNTGGLQLLPTRLR